MKEEVEQPQLLDDQKMPTLGRFCGPTPSVCLSGSISECAYLCELLCKKLSIMHVRGLHDTFCSNIRPHRFANSGKIFAQNPTEWPLNQVVLTTPWYKDLVYILTRCTRASCPALHSHALHATLFSCFMHPPRAPSSCACTHPPTHPDPAHIRLLFRTVEMVYRKSSSTIKKIRKFLLALCSLGIFDLLL